LLVHLQALPRRRKTVAERQSRRWLVIPTRLQSFLDDSGVRWECLAHTRAFTSQGVAAAVHTHGRELAKSVVLKVDGGYAVAVLPAPAHVDLDRFRKETGSRKAELASEPELGHLFPDCELGAEPPFGNLYGLPVWVDERLTEDGSIVFNGGTHTEAVRMDYADFERLAHPRVARFGRP
jgi:Ala-tRNA(Pro) deacylase